MACVPYASGMAAALALHVRNLPDYEKQLHVLYLANDILLKRYTHTASQLATSVWNPTARLLPSSICSVGHHAFSHTRLSRQSRTVFDLFAS